MYDVARGKEMKNEIKMQIGTQRKSSATLHCIEGGKKQRILRHYL